AFFSNTALTTRLSSATVSPSSTISYFAACELAGCKSNSVQINVTVLPSPTSPTNLTTATTICKGTSILLNGSCPSSSTIQWYQGVVDASSLVGTGTGVSVSPNETTIYVATCKSNTNSCESPQSSNINISVADTPSPPTSVSISSTSVCAGASITLSGNCSSGALKFYTNVGLTDEVTAVNTPSATTTYYATCVIGACKSAAVNRTVEVKPQPIAVASSNTPVWIGSTLQLSAANTVSGAAYSWTGPNNFSSSLQNPTIPNVTGAANGPYNLTVSLNGCTASTSTTVVINQQPNLSLNKTDVLCAGENTGTITVNGSLASPPYIYSRNGVDFQSSNVFIGVSNGFNTITISDSKGCTNSAQITVEHPLVL
ncbi:MAG: hypothetical protein NWP83_03955, partial [Spirosomaceae bacterium]|nr:hypothetical protein [Spirosomataceae bacterium]